MINFAEISNWLWIVGALSAWLFVAMVDWRKHEIPWPPTIIILAFGGVTPLVSGIGSDSVSDMLAGLFAGWILYFFLLGVGVELTGQRAIGRGDREMFAAAGSTCGMSSFLTVFLLCLLASAATTLLLIWFTQKNKNLNSTAIPLAPMVAIALALSISISVTA